MTSDPIIVYWSPAFNYDFGSFNLLYEEPQPVFPKFVSNTNKNSSVKFCPAVKNSLKNVYAISSLINDAFEIPLDQVSYLNDNPEILDAPLMIPDSKIGLSLSRTQESDLFYNYVYNLSWVFFASEELEMRFSSPWASTETLPPIEKSFLVPGQYDIGSWLRSINLEYISPKSSSSFKLSAEDDLAYLEFMTNKKIVFKRFIMSDKLIKMSLEGPNSLSIFNFNRTLSKRYELFKRTKVKNIILSEIKKNLVE